MNETVDLARRRDLADATSITLNGAPAAICGVRNRFATVRSLNGRHETEYAWTAVERVVTTTGAFFS